MRGFTIIELILVLAIGSILAATSISSYGKLQTSTQANENFSYIIQTLRTARERSIARLNNYEHGVDLQNDRYTLYQNVLGEDDREIILDRGMSLSWSLSDSSNKIYFTRGFGMPSATGTITLTNSVSEKKVIRVNDIGMVEEQ